MALELASGSTIRQAAAAAGCSPRTVSTLLADAAFVAAVAGYRSQLLDETLGQLTGLARQAVATLGRCLESESDGAKVRAALGILDRLLRIREQVEFGGRLAELEERVEDQQQSTP